MGYATPPTKILGDSAPTSDWNTYVRDVAEHFADDHDHGSADHGALTLGGTGGLTYARLTDASAPDAPGVGRTQLYSVSGKTHQRAGASGPDEELEVTTHSHTQASSGESTGTDDIADAVGTSYGLNLTVAQTPSDSTGSSKYAIVQASSVEFINAAGNAGTVYMRFLKDAVQQSEISLLIAASVGSIAIVRGSVVHIALANASTDFETEVKRVDAGVTNADNHVTIVREIRCQ